MTHAVCNAGRNYLFVSSDGSIYRCLCHRTLGRAPIANIDSIDPLILVPSACDLSEKCHADFLCDWTQSSRLTAPGVWKLGKFAKDYDRELVVNMEVIKSCNYRCSYCCPNPSGMDGSSERSIDDWMGFIRRVAGHFSRCYYDIQHTIGEPTMYAGLPALVAQISDTGGHCHIISNLSCSDEFLDVLIEAGKGRLSFGASMHLLQYGFNIENFKRRVSKIHFGKLHVEVLVVGIPINIYAYEEIARHFKSIGVVTRLRVPANQVLTPPMRATLDAIMAKST